MTQRKRVAQRAIKKLEGIKFEQGAELDEIMADAVKNSPKSISFVPAKVKPEFQADVDQMVAVAEARKARSDAQQVAVPDKSFSAIYPANLSATCKCEHWQSCSDCHPTAHLSPQPPQGDTL